ncbi:GAF domain-containing SpoIIE family protein phosphatase [Actinoplanes sp. GCM10030250]|uniref:GAF domain-containing SpoIIE family protein phosphatase n=1 Tax=Actinoplanes sp. GCM10030250 TaxID=3273376 RepID=UPI00360F4C61
MTQGGTGIGGEGQRLAALLRTGLDAVADPMFDRFAAMVRTVLGVPVALVSLVDADRQFFPGACGLGDPWQQQRQTPLSHSFCKHVVDTAQPLIVTDAREDLRVRGNLAIEELGVIGYAGMPVHDADGRVLGSLCAIDNEPRHWSEQEISLLTDLAAACSDSLQLRIATHHAEQRRQAESDRAQLAAERNLLLLRASAALGGASTSDDVIDTVRDLVIGNLDPAYVGVSRVGAEGMIQLASGRLLPPHLAEHWATYGGDVRTPSGLAARTGRTVILPDLAAVTEETPDALATFHEMNWQAAVSVPLPGPHGPIGALTFCWKQRYSPGEAEQAVLTALSGYVAQALLRAGAYDDRRTAAETMQKALLSPLPETGHVRMTARYAPAVRADLVGGDWYDAVRLDDTRLAVVIGDVAGHGVTSAATMGHYRSMLRALLVDRYDYPSALLARFERAARVLGISDVATVLVAYLTADPTGGHTLTWANAGHMPPALLLPDGTIQQLPGGGPLLGALRGVTRRTHVRKIPVGSRLALYTDGLIETRTCPIDDGIDRLHSVLVDNPGAPLDALADLLMEITPAAAREDDATLLLLDTLPTPPP